MAAFVASIFHWHATPSRIDGAKQNLAQQGKPKLSAERRTFANLIGSPFDDQLARKDLTSDGNVVPNRRVLSHINPVGSTINRRDHERSLSCGYDASRGNKEKILSNTSYRPINGWVHARSQASVFVVHIQFNHHGPALLIESIWDSCDFR